MSLLANAYVDFYKHGRFTFMVVPVSVEPTSSGRSEQHLLFRCRPDALRCYECQPWRHKSWRFTYALMAGASIDVTCNLKADIGYRYRNISGGRMFGYALGGGPGYDKGFSSHEARGGLRYSFGGCAQEEVYIEPAPVMPAVYK
jgi:opacity protein-like surface antigen